MKLMASHRETDHLGVNFYGPFGIVGGLGSAARGYLSALRAAKISVSVIPVNEMFVHHPGVDSPKESAQVPLHPVSLVHANADSVQRFLHFRGRSFLRARYKIGIWVWELPALRDEWCEEVRHFDEIWVPSSFCRRGVASITDKPVTIVPHVVDPAEGPPGARGRLRVDPHAFVFLYMFDAASFVTRKNPFCLVNAFQAAFPNEPGVRLILKVSNANRNDELTEYLDDLKKRDFRCISLRDTMSSREVAALVKASDCYVSPHRSEGFGLTVAEAMAQGVPVIATDYSGTTDFLTEDVGYPLRYRLVEIEKCDGPYPVGAIWAEPSCEHLQELLRHVFADPQGALSKAKKARTRVLELYSATSVGRLIEERLRAIRACSSLNRL